MNPRLICALSLAALACALPRVGHAARYYVDPVSGQDLDHAGTQPTAPWKTLARAQAIAAPGDTIHLASAKVFQEPLVLRSGVTYTTHGGSAPAIISGLLPVEGAGVAWTKDPLTPVHVTQLPASVARQGVTQVFLGGQKLVLARTPNVGQGDFRSAPGSRFARVTADGSPHTLNIDPKVVPAGASVQGATAMIRMRGSDLGQYDVLGWQDGSRARLSVKAVSFTEDWYIAHEYTIPAGHGYWLENKRWMLDSPGEWFHDPQTGQLYIWAPNGQSPQGQRVEVSSLPHGIVGRDVFNVEVDNIQVQDTASDGVSLVGTQRITLRQVSVLRAGRRGIAMAGSSDNAIVEANVDGSAADGIWLGYWSTFTPDKPPARIRRSQNVDVTDSRILNSGTRGYAQAAVRLGEGGRFANNLVQNTPYLGVFAPLNNVIERNVILNSCSGYEDCGGIYVAQPPDDPAKAAQASPSTPVTRIKLPNNVVIRQNIVDGGSGSGDGVPPGGGTDTRGIYLDDHVNGVKVQGNYVSGMRHGYMLHTAFNNELSDNLAIGNRSHNFFMEEHPVPDLHPQAALKTWVNGEMRQNVFERNALVASKDTSPARRAIPNILHVSHGSGSRTLQFGRYQQNRYATLNPVTPSVLAYNYGADQRGREDMDLALWRSIGNDNNGGAWQYRFVVQAAHGFYNSSRQDRLSVNCPSTTAADCTKFIDLKTSEPVSFPLVLEPGAAIIVVR